MAGARAKAGFVGEKASLVHFVSLFRRRHTADATCQKSPELERKRFAPPQFVYMTNPSFFYYGTLSNPRRC